MDHIQSRGHDRQRKCILAITWPLMPFPMFFMGGFIEKILKRLSTMHLIILIL